MNSLDDWLSEPLPPKPRIPRARKKRNKRPEDIFHVAVKKALHQTIADAGILSRDGVIWFTIEHRNAGKPITTRSGKKINLEGIGRKHRGVVGGVPDICIIYRGLYHGIELKATDGVLSDAQMDMIPALRQAGGKVGIARNMEEVFNLLRLWDVPHRNVRF